jgi:hypothetical protein
MPDKFEIRVDGKTYEMPLPSNTKLRFQNSECNRKGHFCTIDNGQLTCFKIDLKIEKSGQFIIGEVRPCGKNPAQKIFIEG